MTTDPVFQPWQSPYNSMDGNPVNGNDPDGLWFRRNKDTGEKEYSKGGLTYQEYKEDGKRYRHVWSDEGDYLGIERKRGKKWLVHENNEALPPVVIYEDSKETHARKDRKRQQMRQRFQDAKSVFRGSYK